MYRLFVQSYARFTRLVFYSLFRSRGTLGELSFRRFVLLCAVIPVLFVLNSVHWVCFLADEVLFPAYRKVTVYQPLFIVGVPRSGTTFFHRLLNGDRGRFTTMTLGEIFFAPSIFQRCIFVGLGRVDAVLGGFGRAAVEALDRRFFRSLRHLHPQSLFLPDEDEQVLFPTFHSASLALLFPFESEMAHLMRFDEAAGPELRKDIMYFYRRMVQRHLYFHGPDKQYLSKSPAFSVKLRSIRETFPDARVVCNVRSPFECISSMASLGKFYWDTFGNRLYEEEFRRQFLEIGHCFYQGPMRVFPGWPEDQCTALLYPELVRNPGASVEAIYARFGWPVSDEFREFLAKQERKGQAYKSTHAYSMEEYGISPALLLEQMRDIFDFYGFPTHPDAA